MSVIGVDFGSATNTVAQAVGQGSGQRGGVSIVLNESSGRFTPSMVSFQDNKRYVGALAAPLARSNFKNTVGDVKRLIGRKYSEPELQDDLKNVVFETRELPDDEIGIVVQFEGKEKVWSPTMVLAMLLQNLLAYTRVYNNKPKGNIDVVLSCPLYFTDRQRRAMLDACAIADVKCLRLLNETTATALSYGIFKSAKGQFDAEKPRMVMFVDIGSSSMSVAVVAFVQGKLQVKGTGYERNLGGKHIDIMIADKINKDFMAKHGTNLRDHPKSWIKVMQIAEKAKKTLSPHGVDVANARAECIYRDFDINAKIKTEEMEAMCAPLLTRIAPPIKAALAQAGLTSKDLDSVEVVGGGVRVRCMKKAVAAALDLDMSKPNHGLSTTLNQDEAVARGCALQCAILTPVFRVKEYNVEDMLPYPVELTWDQPDAIDANANANAMDVDKAAGEGDDADAKAAAPGDNSIVIFKKGDTFPKFRRITFRRSKPFEIRAAYAADAVANLPPKAPTSLGTFQIADLPPPVEGATQAPQIRVVVSHDINGIFSVTSAQLMKEKPEEPEEAKAAGDAEAKTPETEAKEAAQNAEPPAPPAAGDGDGDGDGEAAKEEAKAAEAKAAEGGDAKAAEGGDAAADAKAAEGGDAAAAAAAAEEPKKKKKKKKKKYTRVELQVQSTTSSLSAAAMEEALQAERQMQQQERLLKARDDARNELETYVYGIRDKLQDEDFTKFVVEADKESFLEALEAMEDWLYSEEGFESAKSVYVKKLATLHSRGDPIKMRKDEAENRPDATAHLLKTVGSYRGVANAPDAKYAHLEEADWAKLRDACTEAETWMHKQTTAIAGTPAEKDPPVTCAQIREKVNEMSRACNAVLAKPKPAPPPKKEEPEPKAADAKEGDAAAPADGAAPAGEAGADAGKAADAKEGDAAAETAPADMDVEEATGGTD